MNRLIRPVVALVFLAAIPPALRAAEDAAKGKLYFPPAEGKWETVEPAEAGWDVDKLQAALDFAGHNNSTGVVILYRGKILAETHFETGSARGAKLKERTLGTTGAGHSIEDVASAQKSVASILVGIAQEKGLIAISDPVSRHLGEGWSRATPEQEKAITIRHLLTMTSGLSERGTFIAPPGTRWMYNSTVYAKSMDVVSAAAGMDRNELTARWLTGPLGMSDSKWVPRRAPGLDSVIGWGFGTSARDLARFGLMVLNEGEWNGKTILGDRDYLRSSTRTSQNLNPFYGYLWWVNHNANAPLEAARNRHAPKDMFQASGALNRRCHVVPSLQLVVTRLGDQPKTGRDYDSQFWKLLSDAMPKDAKQATP